MEKIIKTDSTDLFNKKNFASFERLVFATLHENILRLCVKLFINLNLQIIQSKI